MADLPNRVGQRLGNYYLIGLLGKGGFAEVYLGEHLHLGTQAAIKVLHTQLVTQEIGQFLQEARIIAHLEHPHIVRVLDFGVADATPFFVMSYAPNGTLKERHPKGQRLPLPTIVSYVSQVADALQYAHNEKLIHRDIKPGNMLLDRHYNVLLSDFGFALVAQNSHSQSMQEVVGTVAYMSPEQIQGRSRPASDQYSLGIVVYEWLCGDRPFHGSLAELCTQHMFVPPPLLCEREPTVSPDLEQVLMTALAKDPKQRFASVQDFATALRRASQPKRNRRTASFPVVTRPHQPLPPSTLVKPPIRSSEGPTLSPVSVPASFPASAPSPVTRRLSRRTVTLGLVELTIVGGGILWLAISHGLDAPSTQSALFFFRNHTLHLSWAFQLCGGGGMVAGWEAYRI